MPWLQLRLNSDRVEANALESALQACGSMSVTFEDNADDPIFEPELGEAPLWQNTRITGLFDASINSDEVLNNIQQHFGRSLPPHRWHILEDKDWEREWFEHYQPIQCGDNFWICPSWSAAPDLSATNLKLDPGLAFGTGTHPTTFMCLKWISQQDFSSKRVIDYGCGSGILGIAALLLGAEKALGIDIDPQALQATMENAKRNNLAASDFPVFFPNKCPKEPANYLFANILAGPLVELAPKLIQLLETGGKLCLSGVLGTQRDAIIEAYSGAIEIDSVDETEEWVCLIGTKK